MLIRLTLSLRLCCYFPFRYVYHSEKTIFDFSIRPASGVDEVELIWGHQFVEKLELWKSQRKHHKFLSQSFPFFLLSPLNKKKRGKKWEKSLFLFFCLPPTQFHDHGYSHVPCAKIVFVQKFFWNFAIYDSLDCCAKVTVKRSKGYFCGVEKEKHHQII